MKKLALFTILTLIIQIIVVSQGCLPEGIHFKTQEEIDDFNINYPNCTKIEGKIEINDTIEGNITNLLGLSNLTQTEKWLRISNNSMLTNLNGLENFDSIGYALYIINNNSLTSLSAFESLTYVSGPVIIEENPSLTTLEGLNQLDTINYLTVIGNESLQSLSDLINLTRVESLLHIENNQSLSNLSGLDNVVYVGEDLKVFNNDLLTDLQGLNGLKYITSVLKIRYNDQLTSLNGLENLDTINGGLSIWDNNVLSSLESISNCYLNFSLGIHDNPLLEVCNINSICEFLLGNPNYVDIYNNSLGCNSAEEVEVHCTMQISKNHNEPSFKIYPIPAKNELIITNNDGYKIETVNIYNYLGKIVESQLPTENKIDITSLEQGIYIIELESDGFKCRYKILKE